MVQLNEDVKWYIYRTYFTQFILPKIKKVVTTMCKSCIMFNPPCWDCAEFKFKGTYGPGYIFGLRLAEFPTDRAYFQNLARWAEINQRSIHFVPFHYIFELTQLPQNQTYINNHLDDIS
jgi:hypothetical protein